MSFIENHVTFIQHLITDLENPFFICQLEVIDEKKETETNYLVPLDFNYPSDLCLPLFSSLETKMLLCPYDNDMWVRYETTYLKVVEQVMILALFLILIHQMDSYRFY